VEQALEAYALPTETWREVVARRSRYQDLRAKLGAGEITSANDLITFNLDSRRFVEDVITYCTGTDLLRALYESIEHVTVLDPTCGSGAFLFSSLNILEGLYEACLERMQDLVEEREVLDAAIPPERQHSSPDITHFRVILEQVKQHPSRAYFICPRDAQRVRLSVWIRHIMTQFSTLHRSKASRQCQRVMERQRR
jgi:hypothetical protein